MACNVTLYGIKNCSTVKKAMTWLDERKIVYRFHDVRKDGLAREKLQEWIASVGWEKLLNRSGTTFRRLPEEDKANLNEEKAIFLMLTHPAMVKRPVLVGKVVSVGFKPEEYDSLFTNS